MNFYKEVNEEEKRPCPDCREELEETMDTSKLYCIKCQKTVDVGSCEDNR